MTSISIDAILDLAERAGMPVMILKHVKRDYGFALTDKELSYTSYREKKIYLTRAVKKGLDDALLGGRWKKIGNTPAREFVNDREGWDIGSLYHEATHAWMRLNDKYERLCSGEITVHEAVMEAERHYEKAIVAHGAHPDQPLQAEDAGRIVREAAAMYVGHRVRTYWDTLDQLAYYMEDLHLMPLRAGETVRLATLLTHEYYWAMAERVFGYEPRFIVVKGKMRRGPKLPPGAPFANYTPTEPFTGQFLIAKTPMPPKLKKLCDRVLLEGKIPDGFMAVPRLRGLYGDVLTKAASITAGEAPSMGPPPPK